MQFAKRVFVLSAFVSFAPGFSPGVMAQESATSQGAASPEEVVVTGTRLRSDGFEAPTAVTVATAEALANAVPTNVVNALQELPQFLGSANFSSGGKLGIGEGRGQFLSLRNFGAGRTLIMLDSIRMPPTTYDGRVNSEIFPQMLLKRVDIITTGASAAYGSDAVGGVVNYILDHDFEGVKVDTSAGMSSRSDSFKQGTEVVLQSCCAPLRQIVSNAGRNPELVLSKVERLRDSMGYDAATERYVNTVEAGIVDPLKVVRSALENAHSAASMLLSVGCTIVDDSPSE